jgi:hypothetical protein
MTPPPPDLLARVAEAAKAWVQSATEFSVEVAKNGIAIRQTMLGDMLVKRERAFHAALAANAAYIKDLEHHGRDAENFISDLRNKVDANAAEIEELKAELSYGHEHLVSARAEIERLTKALEQYGLSHQDAMLCGQGFVTVVRVHPTEVTFTGEIIRVDLPLRAQHPSPAVNGGGSDAD